MIERLKQFLESRRVPYRIISHAEAFSAPEIAHALHVPGRLLAKVVIVKADQRHVMAVLPSNWQIDFKRFAEVLGAREVRLASEDEFKGLFPDCEVGTMPPFGNLYNLDVYVDQSFAKDGDMIFEAGTHHEAIKLRYKDFVAVVHPTVAEFHRSLTHLAG